MTPLRPAAGLLLVALVLAGCLSGAPGGPSDAPVASPLIAHRATAGGATPASLPATFAALRFESFATGFARGEPTVGVTSDGVLFATASGPLRSMVPGGEGLIGRSTDGGRTWQVVRDAVNNAPTDTDPWLWVDPVTDRVWNVPLWIGCSWITWSDDAGDTWTGHPFAGCPVLPGHDHQKLTSGPPPDGFGGAYPTVVYYAYNSFRMVESPLATDGTQVSVSFDGGATWGPSVQGHPSDPCHGGINGPVEVAVDGTAYLPKPTCDGPVVARSDDAGASWSQMPVIAGAGMIDGLATIHAAVDDAGTVYVLWPGADLRLYLSYSTDRAETWSEPVVVSAPEVGSVVFGGFDAGSAGRLGVAYIGTNATDAQFGEGAPPSQTWHFYGAIIEHGDTPEPLVVTHRVTTEADPVERGCIRGAADEPCRNLRDFIDVQVRGGRMIAVYADGCDACAADDSDRLPRGETVVAVLQTGPSLADGSPLTPFLGQTG